MGARITLEMLADDGKLIGASFDIPADEALVRVPGFAYRLRPGQRVTVKALEARARAKRATPSRRATPGG